MKNFNQYVKLVFVVCAFSILISSCGSKAETPKGTAATESPALPVDIIVVHGASMLHSFNPQIK